MPKLPEEVAKFMEAYGLLASELWEVRPGSGSYAIKHKALERIAAEQKIAFEPPTMLEFHAADKIAVLCVTGKMGERSEWSIGEQVFIDPFLDLAEVQKLHVFAVFRDGVIDQ